MSVDKLVDSTQLDTDLTSVANAIRAKSGGSSQLAFPAGFVSEIQAIPSGGGQTVYTSSGGLLYTPIMTIDTGMGRSSGWTLSEVMTFYGSMPYLEELTLTGVVRNSSAGSCLGAENQFTNAKYPLLKKIKIQPTEIRNGSGNVIDPSATNYNQIKAAHYVFGLTNLTELVIGKVGGPYWAGGGYFRNKNELGNAAYTTGSTDGLTLKIYVASYLAKGGFSSSNLATNTTVIEYDYQTGEVLTA